MDAQIRWLIRRDYPEVLEIERESFDAPWTEEEIRCCLRQCNCIGYVAELDHQIVGFMIYELHKSRLRILKIAVASEFRQQGYGSQMVEKLVRKLPDQLRKSITLEVRETNVPAQLFFKSQGFQCESLIRDHYDDTSEDAYVMCYRLSEQAEKWTPKNRISDLFVS